MKKIVLAHAIAALGLIFLVKSSMLVPPVRAQNPALLRIWASEGSYVGLNSDPWIHESWGVSSTLSPGASLSFDLYIDAMNQPAYNVYLAVAVNDTAQVASITVGSSTITTFTYGTVTWPSAAGGGTIPPHGVYPTNYALVLFGNIDSNYGSYTVPYGPYNAYRAHITVTITTKTTMNAPFKVHFDAQGVLASGGADSNPFSHDLTAVVALPTITPPVAWVDITSPTDGSTLYTDFAIDISETTPMSRTINKKGTVTPRLVITPSGSRTVNVAVSYSNTGGVASGSLTLKDNGVTVGTLTLTDFQGSALNTFSVTLTVGTHVLLVTLSLSNAAGSSTASDTHTVTVSSTIGTLTSLSFVVTGPQTHEYNGKLTYVLTQPPNTYSGNWPPPPGLDSAESFTSLAIPYGGVSDGGTLDLREAIQVTVTSAGNIVLTVSVTANGYTHTASLTFAGTP